ncbi:hypothetical protein VTI74DRAFT_7755 [Chaetomium olivicolor]
MTAPFTQRIAAALSIHIELSKFHIMYDLSCERTLWMVASSTNSGQTSARKRDLYLVYIITSPSNIRPQQVCLHAQRTQPKGCCTLQ